MSVTKKKKAPTKPTRKPKLCCIFGVGTQGLGAALFPDCVVFNFETGPRNSVEVSGFETANMTDTAATGAAHVDARIAPALVDKAKKSIREEYGNRWRKLVVVTLPVK